MPVAYIGIGSNIGDRRENCGTAISILEEKGVKIVKRSSSYETEPWGVMNQPKFINMAIEIETSLPPQGLLALLKETEAVMGRQKGTRWGPRIIDLDILLYDDTVMKTDGLEIPHPEISRRAFVLEPLAEIAPEKEHPVLKKTISELFLQYRRSS